MIHDFSTLEKRQQFIKTKLVDCPSNEWSRKLPNLKWLTPEEFAQSAFFQYEPGIFFYQTFGGPNKSDNHEQCPQGFDKNQTHYARAFLDPDMSGFVLLANYRSKKLAFGRFKFCKHEHKTCKNLGRCWNRYTCNDCGYSYEVDSSD